jgi:DNA-binding response OmpR family regulator
MAEVVLVRWPEDGDEGLRLATAGVAVLYLLDGDEDPPRPTTCMEDWVRLPGDDRDLSARVAALELRALSHQSTPRVDERGRLHYRGELVPLPEDEARLAGVLAAHFGTLVPDELLAAEAGYRESPGSLRTPMTQLRSRLRLVGLAVRRIRRRGYVLQGR